jgi:hypothetical protein
VKDACDRYATSSQAASYAASYAGTSPGCGSIVAASVVLFIRVSMIVVVASVAIIVSVIRVFFFVQGRGLCLLSPL